MAGSHLNAAASGLLADLMASLYGFEEGPSESALQSAAHCEAGVGLLAHVLRSNSAQSIGVQESLAAPLELLKDCLWLPAYGASALFVPDDSGGCHPTAVVRIWLVALDGWHLRVHRRPEGYRFTSAPRVVGMSAPPPVLACELPAADVREYKGRFKALLSKMQQRAGSRRSASSNDDKGHQRTPGFVLSVLRDALDYASQDASGPAAGRDAQAEEQPESKPVGGFTDVGLHTGGVLRDTSWPLVSASLFAALKLRHGSADRSDRSGGGGPVLLHASALSLVDVVLLEDLMARLKEAGPTALVPPRANAAACVLETAARRAAELRLLRCACGIRCEDRYFHSLYYQGFRDRLAGAGSSKDIPFVYAALFILANPYQSPPPFFLAALATRRAKRVAGGFGFTLDQTRDLMPQFRNIHGVIPLAFAPSHILPDIEAARLRAGGNLDWLPSFTLSPLAGVFSRAREWLDCPRFEGTAVQASDTQVALRCVERVFFRQAKLLRNRGLPPYLLPDEELSAMELVVLKYRSLLDAFLAPGRDDSPARMRVELRSRELLVMWTGYCLISTLEWALIH